MLSIYHRFVLIPFLCCFFLSLVFVDNIISEHISFPHLLRLWSSLLSQFLSSLEIYIFTALITLFIAKIILKILPPSHKLSSLAFRTYSIALTSFAGFFLTLITTFAAKIIIGRARPFVLIDNFQTAFQPFNFEWAYHAMPSGNAATLGALACLLISFLPRFSLPILIVTLALSSLRVFAGVHHLSDILAGFLLGYSSMAFAFLSFHSLDNLSKTDKMRLIDKYIGVPSCFFLSLTRKIWRYIFPRIINHNTPPQHILFINFAELGAIVLTHSAISHAKKEFPHAHIHFLTFPQAVPTLHAMGFNDDHIITINPQSFSSLLFSSLTSLITIRSRSIDTSLNTEIFIRFSTLIAYLSGCKRRVGFHPQNITGSYVGDLVTDRVLFSTQLHATDAYLALVRALSNPPENDTWFKDHIPLYDRNLLSLSPSDTTLSTLKEKLHNASPSPLPDNARFVILNANASDLVPLRRWPFDHYKTLALKLLKNNPNLYIVLTGSPSEENTSNILAQSIDNPHVIPFAGHTSFDELIALYSLSHLLITNDSGPAHFASTTSIPTLVLFGPETPVLFGPVGNNQEAISLFLACSPCISPFNAKTSPCSDPVCMTRISVERVFERAQSLLSSPPS